jgi:hypothetical protein
MNIAVREGDAGDRGKTQTIACFEDACADVVVDVRVMIS